MKETFSGGLDAGISQATTPRAVNAATPSQLRAARQTWQNLGPDFPVDRRLDAAVQAAVAQTRNETTWAGAFTAVAIVAIMAATVLILIWELIR